MADFDIRQDKSYRRGLILGLTVAEIMILLIFVLLMALASALSNRDQRIKVLEDGTGSRLVEVIQAAYPEARTSDDYYKELVRAIEGRKAIEQFGAKSANSNLIQDAELGRQVREAATRSGKSNPYEFAQAAITMRAIVL